MSTPQPDKRPLSSNPNITNRNQVYAEMVASLWANIQPGQEVLIQGDSIHSALAQEIADAAVSRGATRVHMRLSDPLRLRDLISGASLEELSTPNPELCNLAERLAKIGAAYIGITGPARPEGFKDLDPAKIEAYGKARSIAFAPFSSVIMKGLTNRCLIAAATPGWAEKVFPELSPEQAFAKLQEVIDHVSCVSAPSPSGEFLRQAEILEIQRERLQSLNLRQLHFLSEETDLKVGLSEKALWLGGRKSTPDGVVFYANVPIGEIFTTPDWRQVDGHVRVSLPTIIGSQKVDGVRFEYRKGELTSFSATEGYGILDKLLHRDIGASRLGEIALVSMDTPLAQLGILFNEILLDEKGRCHLATGKPYLSNIIGGATMSDEQLNNLGVNDRNTTVHHDFMISDKSTTVFGITASGKKVLLLENGIWAS